LFLSYQLEVSKGFEQEAILREDVLENL